MMTSLLSLNLELLVFPWVRRSVALLAAVARWALTAALALAVLACLLAALVTCFPSIGLAPPVLLALGGGFAHVLTLLCIACLGILTPWCAMVLLRGCAWEPSRWVALFPLVMGLLVLVTEGYALLTGQKLLSAQENAPQLVLLGMVAVVTLNLPRINALSVWGRFCLYLIPLLFMLIVPLGEILDPVLSSLLRGLVYLMLSPWLRWLQQNAPCIAELPPLEEPTLKD